MFAGTRFEGVPTRQGHQLSHLNIRIVHHKLSQTKHIDLQKKTNKTIIKELRIEIAYSNRSLGHTRRVYSRFESESSTILSAHIRPPEGKRSAIKSPLIGGIHSIWIYFMLLFRIVCGEHNRSRIATA